MLKRRVAKLEETLRWTRKKKMIVMFTSGKWVKLTGDGIDRVCSVGEEERILADLSPDILIRFNIPRQDMAAGHLTVDSHQ